MPRKITLGEIGDAVHEDEEHTFTCPTCGKVGTLILDASEVICAHCGLKQYIRQKILIRADRIHIYDTVCNYFFAVAAHGSDGIRQWIYPNLPCDYTMNPIILTRAAHGAAHGTDPNITIHDIAISLDGLQREWEATHA